MGRTGGTRIEKWVNGSDQKSRWFAEGFNVARPDVVQSTVDVFLNNDLHAYAASCRMLGLCDLRASLKNINVPTAVVVGEEDYAMPIAMAQVLHSGIAGSTLKIVNKARHLTPHEVPDVIARELGALVL